MYDRLQLTRLEERQRLVGVKQVFITTLTNVTFLLKRINILKFAFNIITNYVKSNVLLDYKDLMVFKFSTPLNQPQLLSFTIKTEFIAAIE